MKTNHQKDMQVATVHKWQKALDNSIKSMRFLWRHAVVLAMFGLMIKVVDLQTANWRNILISLVIAALVDFFKMKITLPKKGYNNSQEQLFHYAKEQLDSSRFGSSAWAANPGMAGSPANHLYNLGYPNKYNN